VEAVVDFSVERCASCHVVFPAGLLQSDATRPGKYGGSIPVSKLDEHPKYKHLLGGEAHTLDYKESRAHAFALKDLRETKRPQSAVCLQCHSTPVAYYWNERRRGKLVFGPDQTWADAVQKLKDRWPQTLDYGLSCSQCHDPHSTKLRVIRKALIAAVLERGTDPYKTGGLVPKTADELHAKLNEPGTPHKLSAEARRLAGTLTCAQCHVEHVAGPGLDGIVRDDLPWRKLRDVEAYAEGRFALQQDWKHSGTGLPGIKAQHPDVESFWESKHYQAGLGCADCHLEHSQGYANHFMTSPLKQLDGACKKCHPDTAALKTQVLALQDGVMSKAAQLELELDALLSKLEALASDPGFDQAKLAEARSRFMRALLWWDWTAVAAGGAGFHNAGEAGVNLAKAASEAAAAKALVGL